MENKDLYCGFQWLFYSMLTKSVNQEMDMDEDLLELKEIYEKNEEVLRQTYQDLTNHTIKALFHEIIWLSKCNFRFLPEWGSDDNQILATSKFGQYFFQFSWKNIRNYCIGLSYLLPVIEDITPKYKEEISLIRQGRISPPNILKFLAEVIPSLPEFGFALLDFTSTENYFEIIVDEHDVYMKKIDFYDRHLHPERNPVWGIKSCSTEELVLEYDSTFLFRFQLEISDSNPAEYVVRYEVDTKS